jgi:hypothetical protein
MGLRANKSLSITTEKSCARAVNIAAIHCAKQCYWTQSSGPFRMSNRDGTV